MPISKRIVKLIKRIVWITVIALVIHVVFPRTLFLDMTKFNFNRYNDTSYVFNINTNDFFSLIEENKYSIKGAGVSLGDLNELYAIHVVPSESEAMSYEYRKLCDGRKSQFIIVFDVDSISPNETKITYNASSSRYRILCGREFYVNLHQILDFSDRWVEKKPSSIEIYEILRYIGKITGEKNMPPINYPKIFSKKQILETFCNDNPFTMQELFGEPSTKPEK